jgi:antitoxin component of RelBE/YafQ-DinJ toxin-antitoxin module
MGINIMPKINDEQKKDGIIMLRLSERLKNNALKQAMRIGMSVSEYIRYLIIREGKK